MVRISKIQQFPGRNFWKLLKEIAVPFATASKFSKVLVEWKVPTVGQSQNFRGEKRSTMVYVIIVNNINLITCC